LMHRLHCYTSVSKRCIKYTGLMIRLHCYTSACTRCIKYTGLMNRLHCYAYVSQYTLRQTLTALKNLFMACCCRMQLSTQEDHNDSLPIMYDKKTMYILLHCIRNIESSYFSSPL
jgi:hypothetical protein